MIVIDTSALFAILNEEPEARTISRCVLQSDARGVSAPTIVELGSLCSRRFDRDGLARMRRLLSECDIAIVPFDETMAELASAAYERFGKGSKSPAKLNLGDCFSYALAKSLDAPLLFKGDDFTHTDIRPALTS